ncbi:bbe07275-ac97-4d22-acac-940860236127-CDS [Sclerotinia trifoliorum]|uniref:Bbe07275-ac97-4d22-acac-940860236127-CDS n=1 Tax=Sclerotinia trifoliorum TaxID=28548 RepID=A0A8H2VR75_9HELO|nr:bbe07275-ac97-4d22-acac-940860236127-CDS [Sclerotinia trifoliorum]
MWLRIISQSPRCSMPSVLAARSSRSQIVPILIHRGITREFSETCERTSDGVFLRRTEPIEVEDNLQRSDDLDSAHASHREKTVETSPEMAIYRVANDSSRVVANKKGIRDISHGAQQASDVHYKLFTEFLDQLDNDGYRAFAKPSPYSAIQKIPALDTKPEPKSTHTFPRIDANGDERVQNFADSLHQKDFPVSLEERAVRNTNGSVIQETAKTSAIINQEVEPSPKIEQTISICLHLDERVTNELDRMVAKFSQYTPIMNNGRANVAVIKGLPVQHWRQYQVFMRFLQFWRPPFYIGRVKPLMTRLGRHWEVSWQIEDSPEILAIRRTFRQVTEDDLPQYNFTSDTSWEAKAVVTRGLSRTQAGEIVDAINAAWPDGIDLGLITRCVLIHTIFSHGKIRTTVTRSPEFPLMGIKLNQLSHDTKTRKEIESLWNRTMSQIDTTFYKPSKPNKFYKTEPMKRKYE